MRPCPICDDPGPWPDAGARAAHIRSHHETTCPVCGVTLNAGGLDAHLRYVHPDEPAPAAAPAPVPDETPPAPVTVPDVVQPDPPAEPAEDKPAIWSCPGCDHAPFPTLKGLKAHRRSHEEVECPTCGKQVRANGLGPHMAKHRRDAGKPKTPPKSPPVARDAEVLCDECGRTVKASGLGNHRASHRRATERAQHRDEAGQLAAAPDPPSTPTDRTLAAALATVLPGAAGDLIDQLASFVDKHQPEAGAGRWLVVTLDGKGPWLCRTAGVGLVVAREHVGALVVSVDDVYAQMRRSAPDDGSPFHAGQSWPHPHKATA